MKKISFVVLLIILIVNAFSSDCTDKTINSNIVPTSQVASGTQSGDESGQTSQSQSGNDNQQEVASSEIDSDSKSETSDSSSTQAAEGRRLRLLNSLTNDDCKNLKTSDDSKYQCAVKADKTGCEEVDKESSKILYLSFSFLIIFILL